MTVRDYIKASVAEIYSPPRVTKAATVLPRLGIEPGAALDITTCDERGVPWDFTKEEMKRKAEKLLDETKPDLLVGSPMCTKFSSWQRINWRRTRNPRRFKQERAEAVEHLEFVCHLYRKQAKAGRWFLHEHPAQADSWGEQCVQDVLKI